MRPKAKIKTLHSYLIKMTFCVLISQHVAAQAPVHVVAATTNDIFQTVQISGSVVADIDAQLSVQISGLVTHVEKRIGDTVLKDDVLIRLDDTLAKHTMAVSKAHVDDMQIALNDAKRRLQELQQLQAKQSIAESTLRDLAASIEQRQANLEKATAQWHYDKELVARHRIKAPFSGVIAARDVDPGEWVNPGKLILQLVDLKHLWLDFSVPEVVLNNMDNIGKLTIERQHNAQTLPAEVVAVIPVADSTSRSVILRAKPSTSDNLYPGMAINGTLFLNVKRRGIVVPRDAILRRTDGSKVVWTVNLIDGATLAIENPVTLGQTMGDVVEILEGLTPGATVVTRGNESLSPNQVVNVVNNDV
jgi:membrane fusion protein, multidrug efflux system